MLPSLIIAAGLLIAVWLALDWVRRTNPGAVTKALRWAGLAGLVVLGGWLVLTGKLAGLLAIGAGLAPWIGRAMRLHAVWKFVDGLRRRDGGGQSAPPPPPHPPARQGPMSAAEAREVLGVAPDADVAAIRAAHRKLMQANHPDRGGSTWIAARLNQARDVLLGD